MLTIKLIVCSINNQQKLLVNHLKYVVDYAVSMLADSTAQQHFIWVNICNSNT